MHRAGHLHLTSIGCAVANDLWTLVAFRSLRGFSYAAMVSIGIGMYRKIYPPELLGSILGINALIVALGTVAGPTLGGIIVSTLGWPWLFLINVPFGVAALYLGLRNLPADEGSGARLDLSSIGYSVLAIGFVVIAIDQAGRWDNGIVWTLLACGAVLATVFLRRQRRLDAPLLPLDIFASSAFPSPPRPRWPRSRHRAFPSWPCRSCSSPSMDTAPSSRPCCSRRGGGGDRGRAAVGRLSDKINATLLSTIGVGIFALGLFLIASMDHAHDVTDILWRLGLCGLGFGFPGAQQQGDAQQRGARARAASGVLATARTLGQSLGAAVVAVVLSGVASQLFASGKVGQMQTALWIAGAIAMASCCLSLVRIHR